MSIADNKFFNQSYWDGIYENSGLLLNKEDEITAWLKGLFKNIEISGSCFEIGCFPGSYLVTFGKMNLELNGIDATPRVKELPGQLNSYNFKIGKFYNEDFFDWLPERKYDLVCSFGFIEHFKNWEKALKKQMSLVKNGGYLIVEAPNFYGLLQRSLHYFLDKKNYKRHNISAMSPNKWSLLLGSEFEILYSGYFGEFNFWVEGEERGPIAQKILDKIIINKSSLKKILKNNNCLYSPYCGVLAKKIVGS